MTFFEIFSQIYKLSSISKLPRNPNFQIFVHNKFQEILRILIIGAKTREQRKGGISLIIFENINLHKTCPRKGRANNMKYFALNAKHQAPFRALDCAAQRVGPPSWSHAPFFLPYSLLKISSTFLPPLTRPSPLDLSPAGNNVHGPVTH